MKLSIITINYNNAKGLEKTIKSVVAQTKKCYEYIIIDGGSSDKSIEIIKQNECSQIIWISEKDNGIYNAMNKGVAMARGEYCLFLNSGDEFYDNNVLSNLYELLKSGRYDIISGRGIHGFGTTIPVKTEKLTSTYLLRQAMNHQSTFIKRELLINMPYKENLKIAGDSEFFFNALIMHNATYQDVSNIISKSEEPGASGNIDKSIKERLDAIKMLVPPRMRKDIDFLAVYNRPIVLKLGGILYSSIVRKLIRIFKG